MAIGLDDATRFESRPLKGEISSLVVASPLEAARIAILATLRDTPSTEQETPRA